MTTEEQAKVYADKHGFRVPYDGSNNFYDDVDVKASEEGFVAGANWKKQKIFIKVKDYIYESLHSGLIDCTNIDLFLDGIKQAMKD